MQVHWESYIYLFPVMIKDKTKYAENKEIRVETRIKDTKTAQEEVQKINW